VALAYRTLGYAFAIFFEFHLRVVQRRSTPGAEIYFARRDITSQDRMMAATASLSAGSYGHNFAIRDLRTSVRSGYLTEKLSREYKFGGVYNGEVCESAGIESSGNTGFMGWEPGFVTPDLDQPRTGCKIG